MTEHNEGEKRTLTLADALADTEFTAKHPYQVEAFKYFPIHRDTLKHIDKLDETDRAEILSLIADYLITGERPTFEHGMECLTQAGMFLMEQILDKGVEIQNNGYLTKYRSFVGGKRSGVTRSTGTGNPALNYDQRTYDDEEFKSGDYMKEAEEFRKKQNQGK